jgi:hypothetical protein
VRFLKKVCGLYGKERNAAIPGFGESIATRNRYLQKLHGRNPGLGIKIR